MIDVNKSTARVICLGEILLDCLADQIGRDWEFVESWTPYPGGAPANVACALNKLGTAAAFIGCVGQDEAGEQLVKLLESVGVNTAGIQRHPTTPTRRVYVTRSAAGERSFAGFGGSGPDEFADTHLKAGQLPESLFAAADYLVTGTLELAYPDSRQAIEKALELAKKHQLGIFLDINWRPVFWLAPDRAPALIRELLSQVDLVKCSDDEAEWLFGTSDPTVIAEQLPGIKGVLVTAGDRGCAYQLGENRGKMPAFPIETVDTTGAGDGFVAGFLHQCCQHGKGLWQDGEMAKAALTYASAVGALTAAKPGAIAAQPRAAEVAEFLARRNFSSAR
jgi:fructokinase